MDRVTGRNRQQLALEPPEGLTLQEATRRKDLLRAELLCHLRAVASLEARLVYCCQGAKTIYRDGERLGHVTRELHQHVQKLYDAL